MLGITDISIATVYILCILSALLCLFYGISNLNKGDLDQDEYNETVKWQEEENKIEETL